MRASDFVWTSESLQSCLPALDLQVQFSWLLVWLSASHLRIAWGKFEAFIEALFMPRDPDFTGPGTGRPEHWCMLLKTTQASLRSSYVENQDLFFPVAQSSLSHTQRLSNHSTVLATLPSDI